MVHTKGMTQLVKDQVVKTIALELLLNRSVAARHLKCNLCHQTAFGDRSTHRAQPRIVAINHHGLCGLPLNKLTRQFGAVQEGVLEHDICADQLAGAWVGKTWTVTTKRRSRRRRPAKHVVTNITRIPICIVRLDFDRHGVAEAGMFECFVPLKCRVADQLAPLYGRCIFDPPGDGLNGIGNLR